MMQDTIGLAEGLKAAIIAVTAAVGAVVAFFKLFRRKKH